MRVYCTIKTGIECLAKQYGLKGLSISIDSLTFETKDTKEVFYIDFEECDTKIDSEEVSFRLKSLGVTFQESWEELWGKGIELENRADIFRSSNLTDISLYISSDQEVPQEFVDELAMQVTDVYAYIAEDEVHFESQDIAVDIG